jgi:subtilisin family serine protease
MAKFPVSSKSFATAFDAARARIHPHFLPTHFREEPEFSGPLRAKFRLYPTGPVPGEQLDAILDATVNGGTGLPYPPVVDSVDRARVGGDVVYTITGWQLDSVQAVTHLGLGGEVLCSFDILQAAPSLLVARATHPEALPPGVVKVVTSRGTVAAQAVGGEPQEPLPLWAPGRLLVRFRDAEVDPPKGSTGGPTGVFSYRPSRLRDDLTHLGILRLDRLLPWFEHADARGTNGLGEPVRLRDLANLYTASLDSSADLISAAEALRRMPEVLYAHRDVRVEAMLDPNDPMYPVQWGLHYPPPLPPPCTIASYPDINVDAPSAWDRTTGSSNTRVAILDTGIKPDHLDLLGRVDPGICFVGGLDSLSWQDDAYDSHGTAVAGLVGATGNNAEGIAGLDWQARLVPVKVLDLEGYGYVSWLIQGIDWARHHGIPILNMSLGVPQSALPTDTLAALLEVCDNAFISGQLLVAASGNVKTVGGVDQLEPILPAALHQRVLAVGAIHTNGWRWRDVNFPYPKCGPGYEEACRASNYGDWLDLEAPGGRYIVTTRGVGAQPAYYTWANCWNAFGGTSAAAPVVTGAAALLKSYQPWLAGEDLEQLLKMRARNIYTEPYSEYNVEHGWGFVRAGESLAEVAPPKMLEHWSVGSGPSFAPLTVVESEEVEVRFVGAPGVPSKDTTVLCVRHRLQANATFPLTFVQTPRVWVRAAGTVGWRDTSLFDHWYEVPFGRITDVDSARVSHFLRAV